MATKKIHKAWDKDAVDNGLSSQAILLDWLTTQGNYSRWKGTKSNGITIETLCGEVVGLMLKHEIKHRSNHDIRTKINEFERQFRSVTDWLAQTGQGIMESDQTEATKSKQINDYILKKCKHYHQLQPIMAERASTSPLFTNEQVVTAVENDNASISDKEQPSDVEEIQSRNTDGQSEPSSLSRKRSRVSNSMDMWQAFSSSENELEKTRLILEEKRDQREADRALLEKEKLLLDIEVAGVNAKKSRLLARKELRDAGVPENEINASFPI